MPILSPDALLPILRYVVEPSVSVSVEWSWANDGIQILFREQFTREPTYGLVVFSRDLYDKKPNEVHKHIVDLLQEGEFPVDWYAWDVLDGLTTPSADHGA